MQIANITQNLTMTSREIAELTGKQHKDVLHDIRKMLVDLEINSADFSAEYKDSTGRTLPAFKLPKRETLILVSGYNVGMRAKIIDRWQELESQPAKPPAIRNQNLAMIIQMATEMDAIQTAQQQQAIELAAVQKEIKTIGARSQPDTEFFTVLGYATVFDEFFAEKQDGNQ